MAFCAKCGTQLADGAKFCASCGTSTEGTVSEKLNAGKEKVNAGINKLPFRKLAEEKISAGARAKVPLLDKAIPFANLIVCGLAVVLVVVLVVVVASFSGKKGVTGSPSDGAGASEQLDNEDSRPVVSRVSAGDFGYVLNEKKDGVIIVYMTAKASAVVVPDKIENLPVTGIISHTLLFSENKTIRSVTLPATITEIPEDAFLGCTALTNVTMPGVTIIGIDAFRGCTALTNVTMPVATNIGRRAFEDCTALTNVTMPGVTNIGSSAFRDCTALTNVTMPGVTDINIGENAFRDCTALTNVTMPGATIIGAGAFRECTNLTKVTLGDGLTTVEENAFYECLNLSDLTVPASLTRFPSTRREGSLAFCWCDKLPLAVRDKLVAQGYPEGNF